MHIKQYWTIFGTDLIIDCLLPLRLLYGVITPSRYCLQLLYCCGFRFQLASDAFPASIARTVPSIVHAFGSRRRSGKMALLLRFRGSISKQVLQRSFCLCFRRLFCVLSNAILFMEDLSSSASFHLPNSFVLSLFSNFIFHKCLFPLTFFIGRVSYKKIIKVFKRAQVERIIR